MSDDLMALLRDSVRVSSAVPPGEIWLQSGCSWAKARPGFPHGAPGWRVAGMCVHEHLERVLLCDGCKGNLERWQKAERMPWCDRCYRMRPGGHHCTVETEIRRL